MLPDDPLLCGRLFRAARALLQWSQARLAAEVGVSTATVAAIEKGRISAQGTTGQAMEAVLAAAGVRFLTAREGIELGFRPEISPMPSLYSSVAACRANGVLPRHREKKGRPKPPRSGGETSAG